MPCTGAASQEDRQARLIAGNWLLSKGLQVLPSTSRGALGSPTASRLRATVRLPSAPSPSARSPLLPASRDCNHPQVGLPGCRPRQHRVCRLAPPSCCCVVLPDQPNLPLLWLSSCSHSLQNWALGRTMASQGAGAEPCHAQQAAHTCLPPAGTAAAADRQRAPPAPKLPSTPRSLVPRVSRASFTGNEMARKWQAVAWFAFRGRRGCGAGAGGGAATVDALARQQQY